MSDQTTAPTLDPSANDLDLSLAVEAKRIIIPHRDGDVIVNVWVDVDDKIHIAPAGGRSYIGLPYPVACGGKAGTVGRAGGLQVMACIESWGLQVSLKLNGEGVWAFAQHLTTEGVRVEVLV